MNKLRKIIMEEIQGFQSDKPKFIIPIGISGSGKSRWIKSLEGQGYVVVSPDDIRRELTGSISDQTKNKEVFPLAFKRTIDALNAGENVIFDATNVSSFHRKQMLDTLKRDVNTEFDAYAKIFDADPEISKQRIRKDIENGVDRSDVPDFAVDRQHKNFTTDLDKIEADGYTIMS